MYLTICGRKIQSSQIRYITITDSRVLITMEDDFLNIRYTDETEIKEARNWLKMQNLQEKDLQEALSILTIVCETHINSYNQCEECPLHKNKRCIATDIPINWREEC